MAEGKELPAWQQQMRVRALRLLGASAPFTVFALIFSSMLPHGGTQRDLLIRNWGDAILIKGRIEMPVRSAEEIQVVLLLEGPQPAPTDRELQLRVKSLDGDFDSKKKWKFKPILQGKERWTAMLPMKLPSGQTVAYRLKSMTASDALAATKLRIVSDPVRSIDRYLRMGEMLLYPSIALCLMAVAMLLFAKVYSES